MPGRVYCFFMTKHQEILKRSRPSILKLGPQTANFYSYFIIFVHY